MRGTALRNSEGTKYINNPYFGAYSTQAGPSAPTVWALAGFSLTICLSSQALQKQVVGGCSFILYTLPYHTILHSLNLALLAFNDFPQVPVCTCARLCDTQRAAFALAWPDFRDGSSFDFPKAKSSRTGYQVLGLKGALTYHYLGPDMEL